MKKAFVIIGALLMLAACSKNAVTDQPVIPDNPTEDTAEFKVSLTISRSDAFGSEPETKATVKREWADGDVVFVFFQGVAAPKYLEMKYSSATQEFTATPRNDLSVSDLGSSGTMTAVYLPYGSTSTVSSDEGNFRFEPMYQGFYLQDDQAEYTCDGEELKGTLNLSAPELADGAKYIHFDVSGYDAAHAYTLYQDYVGAVCFIGVMSNGIVPINIGTPGGAIPGYADADKNILSFSGVLDVDAVGQAKDYQFSINDETASVLYTRDAGTKTLSASKYIGLGSISSSTWNATEYVDLGITSDGVRLLWATKNLGATAESGEGSWGNFYAWSETTGYPLSGTFKNYSSSHAFDEVPDYTTDPWGQLPIENDPAHAALGGLWRTPTWEDFNLLSSNTTSQIDRAMPAVTNEYVDMGNYVGWATYNLGASSVYELGNLYAWGETESKSQFKENNYTGDNSTDPATAVWGAPWRTPTSDEAQSLLVNSTISYGNGYYVVETGEGNPAGFGKAVVFPDAGYGDEWGRVTGSSSKYWTSTAYANDENWQDVLSFFGLYGNYGVYGTPNYTGASIRPVLDLGSANAGATFTSRTTGKTLFLPAAGYIESNNPQLQGFKGFYRTSNRTTFLSDDMGSCYTFSYYYSATTGEPHALKDGLPVRPVFTLDVQDVMHEFPGGLNASDYHDSGDPLEF